MMENKLMLTTQLLYGCNVLCLNEEIKERNPIIILFTTQLSGMGVILGNVNILSLSTPFWWY